MSLHENIMDVIFSRWKSQSLYAGVKLGIFDNVTDDSKEAIQISKEIGLEYSLTYRLLRALASLGFLNENEHKMFSISEKGKILRKDHPQTLQGVILLEEGPEHYKIWQHLPDMIKEGKQNAFVKEYGVGGFEYAEKNPEYAMLFNQAMSSYSNMHTALVLEAIDNYDFSKIQHICDIGGGHGHLIANILLKYPHIKGSVLDLEQVTRNKDLLWTHKMGLNNRCQHISGDMFVKTPTADAYMMKMILHDWNDQQCINILSNAHTSATTDARIFLIEHIVPEPHINHFSKLFDIHMLCWGTGKERTLEEYCSLLEQSGWKFVQTLYPSNRMIGIIEGIKS